MFICRIITYYLQLIVKEVQDEISASKLLGKFQTGREIV